MLKDLLSGKDATNSSHIIKVVPTDNNPKQIACYYCIMGQLQSKIFSN